jgi:hypothetical protein
MLLDIQNMFHSQVTADGEEVGDIIDLIGARNLGKPNFVTGAANEIVVKTPGPLGNADNTVAVLFEGADNEAFDSNKITICAIAARQAVAGEIIHLPIPNHTPKRFVRLTVTAAETTPSLGKIDSYLHTTQNEAPLAGGPAVV